MSNSNLGLLAELEGQAQRAARREVVKPAVLSQFSSEPISKEDWDELDRVSLEIPTSFGTWRTNLAEALKQCGFEIVKKV
jgi:hypothetical protein